MLDPTKNDRRNIIAGPDGKVRDWKCLLDLWYPQRWAANNRELRDDCDD